MKKFFLILLLIVSIFCFVSCDDLRTKDVVKIACIGDSLTDSTSFPGQAYPDYLQKYLDQYSTSGKKYEVHNYGCNGATLTGWGVAGLINCRYFETPHYNQSKQYNPDIVIIMLGTNDSRNWIASSPYYENNLETMINSYRAINKNVRVLILTSPPHNYDMTSNNVILNEVNPIQKSVAQSMNCYLVDISKAFSDYKPSFSMLLRADKLHFNPDGAKLVAKNVCDFIMLNIMN